MIQVGGIRILSKDTLYIYSLSVFPIDRPYLITSLVDEFNYYNDSEMMSGKFKYEAEDAWVSDLDPIMDGGYKVVYFEPNFPLQIRRHVNNTDIESSKQIMQIRIMTVAEGQNIIDIKIEIKSQQDLFNVYVNNMDDKKFDKIKKNQQLNFGFSNLLGMLVKQLNLCLKEMDKYSCVFYINQISNHRLDIYENLQFKRIILLSLDFNELGEEEIKNYITYRFTKIKMNKQIIAKKIKDVMALLKIKNPQLLNQIDKKEKGKETSKTFIFKNH